MQAGSRGIAARKPSSRSDVKKPKGGEFGERAGLAIGVGHGNRPMDFASAIKTLDALLTNRQPVEFNSSWIRKHAPGCYRFIQKNVRREYGGIDWDSITVALDRKFQRLWKPSRARKPRMSYEDPGEIETILRKHPGQLYVFISRRNKNDERIADTIGISFVRLAHGRVRRWDDRA